MDRELPVLHPSVFLQHLLVSGWTCGFALGLCYLPWSSRCPVPPTPSLSAVWSLLRWGGGRGPVSSEASPCSILWTSPWLQSPMAESQRLPFPCLGQESLHGLGQHLGARDNAETPGSVEDRAGGHSQWGCSIPAPSSTAGALPCHGVLLCGLTGKL